MAVAMNTCLVQACKGGLNALTRSIALDYGRNGIRCNAVAPGQIVGERETERLAADPALGARPLRHLLGREVESLIAEEILRGRIRAGDEAVVSAWDGSIPAQRLVAAAGVVVGGVLLQQPAGVALAEHDHVVEQLAT